MRKDTRATKWLLVIGVSGIGGMERVVRTFVREARARGVPVRTIGIPRFENAEFLARTHAWHRAAGVELEDAPPAMGGQGVRRLFGLLRWYGTLAESVVALHYPTLREVSPSDVLAPRLRGKRVILALHSRTDWSETS